MNLKHEEQWIWLPKEQYPNCQTTIYSRFISVSNPAEANYTVAQFSREYVYSKKVIHVKLRYSGDTVFRLFCNHVVIATGPICVGGDFIIGSDSPWDNFYASEQVIYPNTNILSFFAEVRMMPVQLWDFSKGCGGFMLFGEITFEDGTREIISTDETWMARQAVEYISSDLYDQRKGKQEFVFAQKIQNVWHTETAPIPQRAEKELLFENGKIRLKPNEKKQVVLEFEKIHAGFLKIVVHTRGELSAEVYCRELEEMKDKTNLIFSQDGEYRGFELKSVGNLLAILENRSDKPTEILFSIVSTHYPIDIEAKTVTDDQDLNFVLDLCRHNLKYCRQTIHLDSPRHCEPLACTGDYYIESLMTLFSFGDMRLAEFDLRRTAEMLIRHNGRMFHTTYSLIWIRMLYDVYMATGNRNLFDDCRNALTLLLRRFEGYIGETGLIETPPDYMFVDWVYVDHISLHHPPKALGQSCLNMFYYGGLDAAEKLYLAFDLKGEAEKCHGKKNALKAAINQYLFDSERGVYFEGLNTPTEEHLLGEFMPQNVEKKYYRKHSNILAVCFGVCDDKISGKILDKIMSDEIEGEYQPYFAHFLLEAIYLCGKRSQYTLAVLQKWKQPSLDCPKGLVEGFVPPAPTYKFDHSHAWAGTPLYSLPKALLGLEIMEAGMSKICLSPDLLGLKEATVELPTSKGMLICKMKEEEAPEIIAPKGIKVILRDPYGLTK